MNRLYFLILIFLPLIINCEEEAVRESTFHSGYIRIGCDFGPYYFHIASLEENCGAEEALGDMLKKSRLDSLYRGNLILPNSCFYDEIKDQLGSESLFDLKLERGLHMLELSTSFPSRPMALELDNNILSDPSTHPPFLGGFELDLNPGKLRIYAINIWIGGCLHDMVIWEKEE